MNNSNSSMGRVGLGCVTFGREIGEDQSYRILDYAWENGVRLFDTAEAYGGGESERILGNWIANCGVASEALVMTKATFRLDVTGITEALSRSLDRLRIDRIAYYLLHRFEPSVPLEEQLAALEALKRQGLIQHIGWSNLTLIQLRQVLAIASIGVLQNMYSLAARELEGETIAECRNSGVSVVAFSPLAAGFLTGKYRRDLPKGTRFEIVPGHRDVYFSDANFALVEKLHALAGETGISAVRLAMGWVLKNPDIDCVLVGARQTEHVENALMCLRDPVPAAILMRMD